MGKKKVIEQLAKVEAKIIQYDPKEAYSGTKLDDILEHLSYVKIALQLDLDERLEYTRYLKGE